MPMPCWKRWHPHLEAGCEGPVTDCDCYLRKRLTHLDYQGALEKGLPIGSGEIESAHRYVIRTLDGRYIIPSTLFLAVDGLVGEENTFGSGLQIPIRFGSAFAHDGI